MRQAITGRSLLSELPSQITHHGAPSRRSVLTRSGIAHAVGGYLRLVAGPRVGGRPGSGLCAAVTPLARAATKCRLPARSLAAEHGQMAFVVVSLRSRQEAPDGVMEFFQFLGLIEDGGEVGRLRLIESRDVEEIRDLLELRQGKGARWFEQI
jgi:hypothetical protein